MVEVEECLAMNDWRYQRGGMALCAHSHGLINVSSN